MKQLPRIQYITHPDEDFENLAWIHRLHENGINWIQLRIKEETFSAKHPTEHFQLHFHTIADRLRMITSSLGMLLTINDNPEVTTFSNADGIHVGQEDEHPSDIRKRLGIEKIIGATANSWEELQRYEPLTLDYIGVGPFQSTSTKITSKKTLGIEGYQKLVITLLENQWNTPIFAIGGVEPENVSQLLETGVYGIAICGAVFHQQHNPTNIQAFVNEIKKNEIANRR